MWSSLNYSVLLNVDRQTKLRDCYHDAIVSVAGLPEHHSDMLIGIVVQRYTGRDTSKMEQSVHEPTSRLPVTEVQQVHSILAMLLTYVIL